MVSWHSSSGISMCSDVAGGEAKGTCVRVLQVLDFCSWKR